MRPIATLMLLTLFAAAAHAAPARDDVVARNLLPRSAKQAVALLAARSDEDPATRLDRVRQLLQQGRATGDTRALGLADALLAGAVEDDEVRILRATISSSLQLSR